MLNFLLANLATIIVLFVLITVVVLVIIYIIRSKKKGNSCSGGCVGCPMSNQCSNKNNKDK